MFKEIIRTATGSLDQRGIQYMITGSLAFNVYCIPRMTMDIDFVIELDQTNVSDFLEIFQSGYYMNEETVKLEIKRKGIFNVIDHGSGLKMDFIVKKDSEFRRLEFSRKIFKMIEDIPVWIVSAEDLIISKIEWIQQLKSDRQIQDIRMLLASPGIDTDYVTMWCKRLNFNTYDIF